MPSKRSPEFDKRCIKLYLEGQKTIDICRSMGIADRTLYKLLEDHGVRRKRTLPLERKKDVEKKRALLESREKVILMMAKLKESENYYRNVYTTRIEVIDAKLKEMGEEKAPLPDEVYPRRDDLRISDVDRMVGDIPWSYGEG